MDISHICTPTLGAPLTVNGVRYLVTAIIRRPEIVICTREDCGGKPTSHFHLFRTTFAEFARLAAGVDAPVKFRSDIESRALAAGVLA